MVRAGLKDSPLPSLGLTPPPGFLTARAFSADQAAVADLPLPERSFVHVLHEIVGNLQNLLRYELRLAKTELREEFSQALRGALMCCAAGVAGLLAIIFLLLAIQFALTRVMPDWAAASIISASLAICAVVALAAGVQQLKQVDRSMPKTMRSLQENGEWAKQQIK